MPCCYSTTCSMPCCYSSCVSSTTSSIKSLMPSSCSARCASRRQGYTLQETILERPDAVDAMYLKDSMQARRMGADVSRRSHGSVATCSRCIGMLVSSPSRSSHPGAKGSTKVEIREGRRGLLVVDGSKATFRRHSDMATRRSSLPFRKAARCVTQS
jgi:hypothetical protein